MGTPTDPGDDSAGTVLSTREPAKIDADINKISNDIDVLIAHIDGYRRRDARSGSTSTELIASTQAALDELIAKRRVLEDEHSRRPWSRYWKVIGDRGHVHRSTACQTCHLSTRFFWLTDLSGATEAEMIVEWGSSACTVCFPDAPLDPGYARPGRVCEAEAAQREADKAEREAIKAAKNLTVDEMFRNSSGDKVTTVAAAKQALRDIAETKVLAGSSIDTNGYYTERCERDIPIADAARRVLKGRGLTDDELDTITERAEKRARKTWSL